MKYEQWYETRKSFMFGKEQSLKKFEDELGIEHKELGLPWDEAMSKKAKPYEIEKVIYNNPATIILWMDGTKTVVKCCEDDEYDPYVGVSMAINKKLLGDDYKLIFKKALSFYEEPEEEEWNETYDYNDETVSVNNLKIKLDELKRAFNKLDLQSAKDNEL